MDIICKSKVWQCHSSSSSSSSSSSYCYIIKLASQVPLFFTPPPWRACYGWSCCKRKKCLLNAKCSNLNNDSFMTCSGILVSLTFTENKIVGSRSSSNWFDWGRETAYSGGRKGLQWCGFALFLVRFCANFYFNLRYCAFTRLSRSRCWQTLGTTNRWKNVCVDTTLLCFHWLLLYQVVN